MQEGMKECVKGDVRGGIGTSRCSGCSPDSARYSRRWSGSRIAPPARERGRGRGPSAERRGAAFVGRSKKRGRVGWEGEGG